MFQKSCLIQKLPMISCWICVKNYFRQHVTKGMQMFYWHCWRWGANPSLRGTKVLNRLGVYHFLGSKDLYNYIQQIDKNFT